MTRVFVTYPGDAGTQFDRDHYVRTHLPLVLAAWRPYGLETVAAFFPSGDGAGTICICECVFRDDAAVQASLAAPQTGAVMADVANFTDVIPLQLHAAPL